MADVALLASQRAEPARLVSSGYVFKHPELKAALRSILKK
jgi:NAD dependent epimerase/dehydratase family enzyme